MFPVHPQRLGRRRLAVTAMKKDIHPKFFEEAKVRRQASQVAVPGAQEMWLESSHTPSRTYR